VQVGAKIRMTEESGKDKITEVLYMLQNMHQKKMARKWGLSGSKESV
jgi:hypothetical protein